MYGCCNLVTVVRSDKVSFVVVLVVVVSPLLTTWSGSGSELPVRSQKLGRAKRGRKYFVKPLDLWEDEITLGPVPQKLTLMISVAHADCHMIEPSYGLSFF